MLRVSWVKVIGCLLLAWVSELTIIYDILLILLLLLVFLISLFFDNNLSLYDTSLLILRFCASKLKQLINKLTILFSSLF